VATLATVDLRDFAELFDGFLFLRVSIKSMRIVVIPPLEVAQAKLPLRVFLITGPLARFLLFHSESHAIPRN
jgi:hypothetical protein